jgi:hypothetical protein
VRYSEVNSFLAEWKSEKTYQNHIQSMLEALLPVAAKQKHQRFWQKKGWPDAIPERKTERIS